MSQETTLILLKPDTIAKGNSGLVLQRFEAAGFKIRGLKMMQLTDAILAEHYSHIADKPFYPEVARFMQQTPVIALALSGDNVITAIRDMLGPTDSRKAPPGTIRGDLGVDNMTNVCHASDGPQAATEELKRFFKEGEIF